LKQLRDARYYRNHVDHVRARARAYYHENYNSLSTKKKARTRAQKERAIRAYGGRCACCGERTIEFLTIDHANGDGAEHRRRVGRGRHLYADIEARGFPQDAGYQVLCFNCNIALGFYGYCPHHPQRRRHHDRRPRANIGRPRRLAEAKGSPAIDHEDVLFVRRASK